MNMNGRPMINRGPPPGRGPPPPNNPSNGRGPPPYGEPMREVKKEKTEAEKMYTMTEVR